MNDNDALSQAYLYFQHGKLDAAYAILQPLAQAAAADVGVLHLGGAVAAGVGQHAQAIAWFRRALLLTPGELALSYKLGRVLVDAGQPQEALNLYLQLITDGVRHADIHVAAALLLEQFGRREEALQTLEHALQMAPQAADIWHRHAALLARLQRHADALHSVQQALALAPDNLQYQLDLALALYSLHRNEEALAGVDQVLRQEPRAADAWACRAAALSRLCRYEESIAASEQALRLQPDNADSRVNLALTRLTLGQLESAWPLYEARWSGELADPRRHRDIAPWPGLDAAAGKTILLWAEQGLGDTIHFCRYALQVAALGARVVLEVPATLSALMRTLELNIIVKAQGEPLPPVDYQLPLMSLPLMFNTRLEQIPSAQPYLHAAAHQLQRWQDMLGAPQRLRVGIVCSGNAGNHNDRRRSIPLAAFAPLLDLPEIEFFLLQPEIHQRDEPFLQAATSLHWPGRELQEFDDTAALIACLDLVVGVDTAAIHLAGALGVPTWVLLSKAADWRWFLKRDDSPWYASATLLRQTTAGDWDDTMLRVRDALIRLTGGGSADDPA